MRERDSRNGTKELVSGGLLAKIPFGSRTYLMHPGMAGNRFPVTLTVACLDFQIFVIPGQGPMTLVDINAALARAAVTWNDLRWIREQWRGLIVVKGVLTGEDARHAIDEGAAAVWWFSNHGGRQRSCVPASLKSLARSSKSGKRSYRGADGRRYSPGHRCSQGHLLGRASRFVRSGVCVRPRGGW